MRFILLYGLLFVSNAIMAQIINDGLFANDKLNEFVIIRDDTIQFRIYNNDAFATYTIGEGVIKNKGREKYIIKLSTSFIEKTSILYRRPRNDDRLSIQILTQENLLAEPFIQIKISQSQDEKPYITTYCDEKGQLFLDEKQIDYLDRKKILISISQPGYTSTETRTQLEKNYDYVIKSRVPTLLSGSIATGRWNIRQLSEDEILISSGKSSVVKLKKITNLCPYFDFPFDKDVKTIIHNTRDAK